jgi:Ca2+-binding RTX toxin-like protein
MPNVTVPGANNSAVTLSYDTDANALIALHVAGAIAAGIANNTIQAADSQSGPPPSLPPSETGEFVQDTTGVNRMPAGYTDVVDTAATAVIFGSTSPNQSILVGDGNLTFYASAGSSGTIAGGGGNNSITIPTSDAGAWNIGVGNGNNAIRALGSGNDTISAGGGNNSIQLGSGSDFITTAGFDTVLASTGSETLTASGSDEVYGNSSQLLFIGTGGGVTVYGGAGSDTVYGANGPDVMFGGAAGNNYLQAGVGAATLFGGGNGDQLFAGGSAAQALYAAGGNETLFGGFASGNDTLYGGAGSDQIYTSAGNSTVVAGSGAATVAATGSNTVFDFISGQAGGTELVQDLTNASQVHITLTGYGPNEAANALAGQTTSGGAVTIKLSDNTTITFQNVARLTSGNFT